MAKEHDRMKEIRYTYEEYKRKKENCVREEEMKSAPV